jgi:steroid 5-alpha reductase family enzyme
MPLFQFDSYYLLSSAVIVLGIQIVFFFFASLFKTDKVTDLSYSLTFVILTLLLFFSSPSYTFVPLLITIAISLWGFRLGGYLFVRILQIEKDDRFDGIRENTLSFAAFWLLQAVTIWIVMVPATIVLGMSGSTEPHIATWVGLGLWAIGFFIETVSDAQKYRFKKKAGSSGKWIQHGLWRYSRHPNYFGESLCWWALFIIVVPYLEGWMWISVLSPLFLTFLLLFVSGVPTVEKRAEEKYGELPEFQQYKSSTSLFIPLPPKKK